MAAHQTLNTLFPSIKIFWLVACRITAELVVSLLSGHERVVVVSRLDHRRRLVVCLCIVIGDRNLFPLLLSSGQRLSFRRHRNQDWTYETPSIRALLCVRRGGGRRRWSAQHILYHTLNRLGELGEYLLEVNDVSLVMLLMALGTSFTVSLIDSACIPDVASTLIAYRIMGKAS